MMLTKRPKKRMIRWRLRVLMAEKKLNNKTLAEMTGIHPTTISRLKNTDELRQISGDVLNALCNALSCTPNDLIEFTPDEPPDRTGEVVEFQTPILKRFSEKTSLIAEDNNDAVA